MSIKIKGWVFQVVCVMLGVTLYVISFSSSLILFGIDFRLVIRDASLIFITTSTISFLLEVSTIKRIANDIASLMITKQFSDPTIYSIEKRKELLKALIALTYYPNESIKTRFADSIRDIDIEGGASSLADLYYKGIKNVNMYDHEVSCKITLLFGNRKIRVIARTSFVRINLNEEREYRIQPIFPSVMETKSYNIKEVTLNGESINVDGWKDEADKHIKKAEINSAYYCKDAFQIVIRTGYNRVTYTTEFQTTPFSYFHAKIFSVPCINFNLNCEFSGSETEYDKYTIKWEHYAMVDMKTYVKDSVSFNEPHYIQLKTKGVPIGGGYVLTICEK